MIFVTVGTHEQSFNRLIKKIDELKELGVIEEDVIIQKGYSTYEPKFCTCFDLIPWEEVQRLNREARIIITHGGPASFIDILSLGKTPIVVPRQSKFNEHVNDHQLEFSLALKNKGENIIVIENIDDLQSAITNYENQVSEYRSNNKRFVNELTEAVRRMFR